MTDAGPRHLPESRMRGQPLLFLGTVVLLWSAARIIHHFPGEAAERERQSAVALAAAPLAETRLRPRTLPLLSGTLNMLGLPSVPRLALRDRGDGRDSAAPRPAEAAAAPADFDIAMAHHLLWAESLTATPGPVGRSRSPLADAPLLIEPVQAEPPLAGAGPVPAMHIRDKRWSVYGWSLLRQGSGTRVLAPGAQYGGSQAGLIVRYAPVDPALAPSLYARAASALANDDDRTLAIGISARPWRALPVDLAVERRFGLGTGQRDRFAAMVVAGGGMALGASRARVEAFGQAGIVGWKDRQGFFDLQMLASRPVAEHDGYAVSVGGGLWAGGQQEVDGAGAKRWNYRVDLGPRATLALPVGDSQMTFALDWRQRVDGQAQPQSGAALTVSAGF